jgi:hypothetical protein
MIMPSSPNSQSSLQLKPGVYEHYKGKRYLVLMTATLESTLEPHVVYVPLYEVEDIATTWLRPLDDFTASVEVNGVICPRFRLIKPS